MCAPVNESAGYPFLNVAGKGPGSTGWDDTPVPWIALLLTRSEALKLSNLNSCPSRPSILSHVIVCVCESGNCFLLSLCAVPESYFVGPYAVLTCTNGRTRVPTASLSCSQKECSGNAGNVVASAPTTYPMWGCQQNMQWRNNNKGSSEKENEGELH